MDKVTYLIQHGILTQEQLRELGEKGWHLILVIPDIREMSVNYGEREYIFGKVEYPGDSN